MMFDPLTAHGSRLTLARGCRASGQLPDFSSTVTGSSVVVLVAPAHRLTRYLTD